MNAPSLFACIVAGLIGTAPAFSQIAAQPSLNPTRPFAFYHNSDPGLSHLNFFEKNAAAMQIGPSDMVLESQNTDKQGITHYKYQQYHLSLPVFGCHYILHEKDGVVRSANGQFQPEIEITALASFNAAGAESFAQRALKSQKYDREKTKATLCFFNPSAIQAPRSLRLAYMVDFHSIEPFDKRRYFIDANNGKVLKEYPLLLQEGVPGKAITRYYGTQDIVSDSLGPKSFVLRDLSRGNGIFVHNTSTNSSFTNSSSFWDLGTPLTEEIGLDAHFCSEKYYDMMLADYDWSGVDGQGGALIANVHDGAYVNAFWDGTSTAYGDGDCNYGPLTTLEIVGHEYTHGMVQHSSALVYSSESGAMNESLADIFGKLLERKIDPGHFSWAVGHSILLTPFAVPFRIMNNPASIELPAYYKGQNWSDFSDVHDNSSIGNLWFSMIVDGKQGVNEAWYHFHVNAIGPDKAGQIVFNTNKNYLTENATYNDFCNASIEVAGNIYGQGSPEQLAVTEAWKAVGLPYSPPAGYFDVAIELDNSEHYFNICSLNQYIPISFSVVNKGATLFTPSGAVKITLSCSGFSDKIIQLNDPIAPGESQDFVIDNWVKETDFDPLSVQIDMDLSDAEAENNTTVIGFNPVEYEYGDLSLNSNIITPDCFEQTQKVNFFVANNSCQNLPVGAEINFSAINTSGNTVWVGPTIAIEKELIAGNWTTFESDVPVFNEEVSFAVIYPPDPYPDNNVSFAITTPIYPPITGDYFNDFEVNNGQDGQLQLIYSGTSPTLLYQNSNFFASTGYGSAPSSYEHCYDPFLIFNNSYSSGLHASMKACVDFSTAATPALEFDAALFLNTYSIADNYPYSSMLEVRWTGNESGNQIIYNQPQGQIIHNKINLPPYFKGKLSIKTYTEYGKGEPVKANLITDDFVLLDNLKLKTATSATQESNENQSILIAPNPAGETTRIQAGVPMKHIRLFNASGQLIQSISAKSYSQDLDLHKLSNGLYWVVVQFENGTESVQKLVKMN